MKCKNCDAIVTGKFCSVCGQNANVSKITYAHLSNEISENILQVNKGFLFTLYQLFSKPGRSIQDYLDGKRKNLTKPITYLLILSTIYFFCTNLTGQNTWMNDAIIGFTNGAIGSEEVEIPAMITWFANNYAYTTLFLLPIFSLASYVCFARYKANYLEHIVLNSYITGQQAIIYCVFALIHSLVKSDILESVPVFVSVAYCIWVFVLFFKNGNNLSIVLRSVLTYVLYILFSTVVFLILIGLHHFS